MNFNNTLRRLGIFEYKERILNSNSHGEMFHIMDYYSFAEMDNVEWFAKWFNEVVENAEETWERPDSVFQHIGRIYDDMLNAT